MSKQYKGMQSKELSKRIDEIIKQQKINKRIRKLQEKIGDTCLSIYKELTKMVGTTKVAIKTSILLPAILTTSKTFAYAGSSEAVKSIQEAFEQLMSIATAIAEPILWFYALTSLILMATGKSKAIGWNRLKNVGYAYIGMTLLPTIFAFLRWISGILKSAFTLVG